MEPCTTTTSAPSLTEWELAILDFEAQRPLWVRAGAHEASIRTELGLTARAYRRILERLLEHPAAAAHAPVTVHRLRRRRELQVEQRTPWST